jgi:hypothetical protein
MVQQSSNLNSNSLSSNLNSNLNSNSLSPRSASHTLGDLVGGGGGVLTWTYLIHSDFTWQRNHATQLFCFLPDMHTQVPSWMQPDEPDHFLWIPSACPIELHPMELTSCQIAKARAMWIGCSVVWLTSAKLFRQAPTPVVYKAHLALSFASWAENGNQIRWVAQLRPINWRNWATHQLRVDVCGACPKSVPVPSIFKGMSQERACPKNFEGPVPRAGLSQEF